MRLKIGLESVSIAHEIFNNLNIFQRMLLMATDKEKDFAEFKVQNMRKLIGKISE